MLKSTKQQKIYAVDLFCEIGELPHDSKMAGENVRAGIDIDQTCQHLFGRMRYCRYFLKNSNSQWMMKQYQCRRWHFTLARLYQLN